MTDYKWPIITKDTPLSEIKEIHRRIWDYVIEHGEKPETPYESDCVLCEYDRAFGDACWHCPARWSGAYCTSKSFTYSTYWPTPGTPAITNTVPESEYYAWLDESDPEKKRHLAMKIRDIEFKGES